MIYHYFSELKRRFSILLIVVASMKRKLLVGFGLFVSLMSVNVCAGESKTNSVEVVIHYGGGLSTRSNLVGPTNYLSKIDTSPEIVFLEWSNPFHVVIKNRSNEPIFLWRPHGGFPLGDQALTFEFKESLSSEKIMYAKYCVDYTVGAIPQVVKLVSQDFIIMDVDFNQYWCFPFQVPLYDKKEVFMRAVYTSQPLNPDSISIESFRREWKTFHESVWTGKVQTEWVKVRFTNRTAENKPSKVRILKESKDEK